ncbi:DUF4138 domain-containing protein [uncultured Croceitalea sp.]|uniref:DUF4138 domain-containing protein n=1 Tax=uncultured Croceitalea sp. TaxID=1798908 RepID=UPI003305B29E
MKTRILTLAFTLTVLAAYARKNKKLDTIYANEKMNLALFFPNNIRQGIVGSDNFIFTYSRELGQPLGLLKATKGEPSNLLVVTTDGKVYSYIIKYSDALIELNRFVTITESIGHEHKREKPIVQDSIQPKVKKVLKKKYDTSFLEASCTKLLEQPERKNMVKRKNELSLGITNMVYYEDLVFLQLEVKNKSGIDFDVDYLKVAIVSGNSKLKASYQSVPLTPVYIHKMPDKTKHSQTSRFVYVISKFTLADDEKLQLNLKELHGNRELILKRRP